jgi:hypothetical protein
MILRLNSRGTTAIETMISLAVIMVTSFAMLSMLSQGMKVWCKGTSQETATSSATVTLQKLCNEIRDGKSAIVTGAYNDVLTVSFPLVITNPSTGEKTYSLSGTDPAVRIYSRKNGNLVRTVNGVDTIIGRGISQVEFGADNGEVNVKKLTVSHQVGMKTSTQTVAARVSLRNFRKN